MIIEVKRDKKPSREAVSEVAKYVELLSREKHVTADRRSGSTAYEPVADMLADLYGSDGWCLTGC
jgi:hypothetical protein